MSVRVMKNGGPEGSGFVHGITNNNIPLIDSPEMCGGDRWFSVEEKVVEKEKNVRKKRPVMTSSSSSSSSSESSIGKNSDVTGELKDNSGETEEVQSPFNSMDALEEVLPIRRGISRFYNGKSKSFASLADASSLSTIKHIAKPENAYMKKRRNILASTLAWDKNHRPSSLNCNGGGISKRITYNSSSRASALAFALTMSSNNSSHDSSDIIASPILGSRLSPQFEDSPSVLSSSLSSFTRCKNLSAWRSFSLADLQQPGCIPASCTSPSQVDMNQSK